VALVVSGISLSVIHPFSATIASRQDTLRSRYTRHRRYRDDFSHTLRHSLGQEPCMYPFTKAIVD